MNDPDAEFPDRRRWDRNIKKERDQHQIDMAKCLFEWWWHRDPVAKYSPEWEDCDPTIQAFWMDGIERLFRV